MSIGPVTLCRFPPGARIPISYTFVLVALAVLALFANPGSVRAQDPAAQANFPGSSLQRFATGLPDPGRHAVRGAGVDQDRAALTALYRSAGGAGWVNNSNWLTDKPLSTWYGVSVGSDGRVEKLQLVQNGLSGTIPSQIGDLNRLDFLNLSVNSLYGPVPQSLGNLTELDTLGLSSNRLEGSIPSALGRLRNLRVLGLGTNRLSGTIPDELGDSTRLEHLILTNNRLTGPIPSSFGNLARLAHLVLHANQLSGSIPASLGDLARLESLHLNDNSLSGQIPTQLGKLTRLQRVYVAGNRLSGCLPRQLSRVGEGDTGQLRLAICPFGLSDLDVNPGTLEPAFSGLHHEYTLNVAIDADSITLSPHADSGTVEFRTPDSQSVPDADQLVPGYQIQLTGRETPIVVRASSASGGEEALYKLNLVRGLTWQIKVADNLYVQAPGNEDLMHNVPDLEVVFGDQVLRADFLAHFRETGEIERWGYPISEVLILEANTLTQFYQRGVVDFHNVGAGWVVERRLAWDYVGGGRGGSQDQGVEEDVLNPNEGAVVGPWGHKVSNFAIDGTEVGFAGFYQRLGGIAAFGFPKTDARVDVTSPGRVRDPSTTPGFIRQYFQAAVLEFHPNDVAPIKLSLLGDTLRNRLVPNHSALAAFARASAIAPGTEYVPWLATPSGDLAIDHQPATMDEDPATAAELEALVAGNSEFAIELYDYLADSPENLIYSPYSISLAFAMALAGASGETETQLRNALRFPADQARLHPAFFALGNAVSGDRPPGAAPVDGEFELGIANSLWLQKDFAFVEEYLELLADHYGAAPIPVDFMTNHEAARIQINGWVADKTQDRIMDLLQRGVLDRFTRLVLVNAIYFKAGWEYPFRDGSTREMPFYLLAGDPVTVDLMNVSAPLRYWRGDGLQAVELPYKYSRQHMLLIVPDRGRYREVEQSLSTGLLGQIDEGLTRRSLNLWMPKFEFETQLGLADALQEFGARDAFDRERAEFDRINKLSCLRGDRDCLFIKDAIHKAFISVDEDGTEAAAATAIVFAVAESGGPRPQPLRVRIDRPFVFLIRDDATGSILFAGRVIDPR